MMIVEFLVIACDGVFDVMSNEAVADVVRESMRHFNSLTVVASQLVEQALQVILAPPPYPPVTPRSRPFHRKTVPLRRLLFLQPRTPYVFLWQLQCQSAVPQFAPSCSEFASSRHPLSFPGCSGDRPTTSLR